MREILYVEEYTFEDCGTLGGRSFIGAGTDYQVLENTAPENMMANILFDELKRHQSGRTLYPFTRIAIFGIYLDGRVFAARVDDKSFATGKYALFDDLRRADKNFDIASIGDYISAWNLQEYAILQQIDDDLFRGIGYKTPKSKDKYGHAYDVARCLDLRGICRAPVVEFKEDFHNYSRYDLGEDYFIEALNNDITGTREFWLCRDFGFAKFQIIAYDPDDLNYRGLFDSSGNLIIDEQVAEIICNLSDPHEYFYVDNDYRLAIKALKMDGDDELFASYGL